jgi:hypothetical protein
MSQEPDTILRKSLDAVDLHKKRMLVTVVIAGILTLITFLRFGEAFRAGDDVRQMLQLSVATLILWTSCLAFVVVLQLTVMTKRILRAIELSSRHGE